MSITDHNPTPEQSGQPPAPEIDREWLAQEADGIVADLARQFPELPPRQVSTVVDGAAAELFEVARLPNFLPVLIRRRAVRALRAAPTT